MPFLLKERLSFCENGVTTTSSVLSGVVGISYFTRKIIK
jgi:hypothetical protein